jgi:hypothetical protein
MFSKKIQLILSFRESNNYKYLFKVDTFSNKWWAFTQMQLGHNKLKLLPLFFINYWAQVKKNGFSSS